MNPPEPFERPPRPKIDRPPGSYDAIKFDGPCGLAGCRFGRKHYHPRWWVEQKEPRIEIPISMADPGAPMTAKPIPVPHRLKMATESALGVLPPGGTIYLDHWRETGWDLSPPSRDEALVRDEELWRNILKIQDQIRADREREQPELEVRSTYRLPIKISRSRRLIGWAMLTATAGAWAAHLLW